MKPTYDSIKAMARDMGVKATDLLALAPQNDPFYCGAPASIEKAEWFANLWRQFGFRDGVHLRRVHYQLVSQPDPRMHDGRPYENTEGCWDYLCSAGKYARILGYVPAEAFVDRRNPDPHLYVNSNDEDLEPRAEVSEPWFSTPHINTDLGEYLDWNIDRPYVSGYEYRPSDQPFHIELWIEKSTMDDVLLPLGEELGVNVCTSLGFQSITSVVEMLKRIASRGKPARILYVSDFDPAGDGMPVSVARQIEFWLHEFAPDSDIALQPIALTAEQVREYRLPRIPIKDSDRRAGRFEALYGEGAVELDALEALHPGALARIVRAAVEPLRDETLERRLDEAYYRAREMARQQWQRHAQAEAEALADLSERARNILDSYRERLTELAEALDEEMAPILAELETQKENVREKIETFEPELPDRPQGDAWGVDVYDWLFDSARSYEDQINAYRQRKGKVSIGGAGLTQAELAQKAGLSRNGIAVIENGGNVTMRSLKAIGDALGLKLEISIKKTDAAALAAGE